MPRTTATAIVSSRAGTAFTAEIDGDTVNGHQVANTGNTRIIVRNSGASARTFTVVIPKTVDGQSVASKTKSIAAGATEIFGPYPTDTYGNMLMFDVNNAELKIRVIE